MVQMIVMLTKYHQVAVTLSFYFKREKLKVKLEHVDRFATCNC